MLESGHQQDHAKPHGLMKRIYAGSGNPAPSLFDSTVRVTIRQSEIEAIASEAATASNSRGDATTIAGQLKPAVPEDRVMV